MSAASMDPARYYRASIAIPLARKAVFDERMAQIGIKTVGDLVNMVSIGEGVVEALKPVAADYLKTAQIKKLSTPSRKKLMDQIKMLPVEVLERIYREAAEVEAQP